MKRLNCKAFWSALFLIPLAASSAIWALPITLGTEEEQAVMGGEVVTRSTASGEDASSLVPESSPLHKVLSALMPYNENAKKGNSFAVSSVSFISTSCDDVALYNALISVSTQKGITYISRREGYKPKVLFTQSYCIAGEWHGGKAVRTDDIVVSVVPSEQTIWAYQEDSSFGENVYRYDLSALGGVLFAHITNETPMKYHGFTCLKANELSMYVSITPCDGGVLVNTAAIITGHKSTVKVLFATVDLASSFSRRTRALHDWYKDILPPH